MTVSVAVIKLELEFRLANQSELLDFMSLTVSFSLTDWYQRCPCIESSSSAVEHFGSSHLILKVVLLFFINGPA